MSTNHPPNRLELHCEPTSYVKTSVASRALRDDALPSRSVTSLLCALIQTRSINLKQVAAVLSHYRRLQRFVGGT